MAIAIFLISLGTLAAIWLGYPLLMLAVAALGRSRGSSDSSSPPGRVSLIIASREPWPDIEARIVDCRRHCDPALVREVIIGSDHRPGAMGAPPAGLDDWVRVVPSDPPGGKAMALNAAVRAATGELLVFTDTHQRFAPGAIDRLAAAFGDPGLGAASGALDLSGEGAAGPVLHLYWTLEKTLRNAEAKAHSVVGVTGALYAARRSLWRPIPEGVLLDDLWVPMRMVLDRHRIGFVPDAGIRDLRPVDPEGEYRRKVRTLTGVWQLCRWLPDVLLPWRNPIWFQFVCHKLLRMLSPFLFLAAAASGAVLVVNAAMGLSASARTAAGITLLVLLLLLLTAPGSVARKARQSLRMILLMQAAPLHALWNGVLGRWQVWRR